MAKRFPSFLLVLIALLLSIALRASAHGGGVSHDDDDDNGEASSGSPPPNLRSRSLVLVKIWCLILVFAGTFAGGISPYFLKWNETFLLLGTQFAGGVFLGTALMHFLSDSNETFKDLTEKVYPFAFMLASVGYLLTMFADATVAIVFARERNVQLVEEGNHQEGKSGNYELENNLQSEVAEMPAHNQTVNSLLYKASSLGDSILLILALCFHSVFEGIAIGIAKNKADAWKALWTVSLHKVFAAIAMGIALLRMMPNRPMLSCFAYAFAFAISSPVGVAIGIIIDATTQGHVADWIYAISMALACGVFIYVSISHLISKGYEACGKVTVPKSSFARCFAVMLGIGVIAVVMIWDT